MLSLSKGPGHAQHVLTDIGQHEVGRDGGDLKESGFSPLSFHVILSGIAKAAMVLQAGLGSMPARF